MENARRTMPPAWKVRAFWAKRLSRGLFRKFDSEADALSGFFCFACGLDWGRVDRAHIHALHRSGSNEAANLHLLCPICHIESEELTGRAYWRWFFDRHVEDVLALNAGLRRLDAPRPPDLARRVRAVRRWRWFRDPAALAELAA